MKFAKIDEVELHLHSHSQRELLDFLPMRMPKRQIIATTHSPIMAQKAGAKEMHFLQRIGGNLELREYSSDPPELLIHQLLMSEVFGLDTDESMKLEKEKERLEKLKAAGPFAKK